MNGAIADVPGFAYAQQIRQDDVVHLIHHPPRGLRRV
ncbi:hypothetical protein F11_04385 [Rhodospirillum rubrum F11]|nr:hypothetical protein F11_04385 [Rhodospirillum rubrum F11]